MSAAIDALWRFAAAVASVLCDHAEASASTRAAPRTNVTARTQAPNRDRAFNRIIISAFFVCRANVTHRTVHRKDENVKSDGTNGADPGTNRERSGHGVVLARFRTPSARAPS